MDNSASRRLPTCPHQNAMDMMDRQAAHMPTGNLSKFFDFLEMKTHQNGGL